MCLLSFHRCLEHHINSVLSGSSSYGERKVLGYLCRFYIINALFCMREERFAWTALWLQHKLQMCKLLTFFFSAFHSGIVWTCLLMIALFCFFCNLGVVWIFSIIQLHFTHSIQPFFSQSLFLHLQALFEIMVLALKSASASSLHCVARAEERVA